MKKFILLAGLAAMMAAAPAFAATEFFAAQDSASVAINFLELFVAFLQAFIFTFLTTLFIGMSVVLHHDDQGGQHEHHEAAAH